MSVEPRPERATDAAVPTANGNGSSNGASTPATPAVLVPASAESMLAAVEAHLRQEAIEARLVATTTRPVTTARPRPPARDDGWWDDPDAEFWGEARPRRRPPLDVDRLPDDERSAVGRLQARKVRRILRHVSPWSVFKVSALFYLCVWLIVLIAGVILWRVGQEAGAVSNVETFYAKATGEATFELDGREVFRAVASAGLLAVAGLTAFTVMLSILFNLITDMTGGVRMTVVELGDARRSVNTKKAGGRKLLRRSRSGRRSPEPALASSTATAKVPATTSAATTVDA